MNVAILGTGFVAQAYARALHYLGECPLMLSRSWIDYTNAETLKLCLINHKTEMLINCAGYTGNTVDDCEKNWMDCHLSNMLLPVTASWVCDNLGIKMIHISSGCLFTGIGNFNEESPPNFTQNQYQFSKYLAELSIKAWQKCPVWIFRIRMPFSHVPHPRNWINKLASYEVILNGLNSVTWIDEFALRSWQLWQKAPPGIYHAAQANPVRTLEVAEMIQGKKLLTHDIRRFEQNHIQRSEAVLDCSKFEKAYGTPFTDSMTALRWCLPIWKGGGGMIPPYETAQA